MSLASLFPLNEKMQVNSTIESLDKDSDCLVCLSDSSGYLY